MSWYGRSFLGRLDERSLTELMALGVHKQCAAREIVMRQGEPGGTVYVLLEGRVNVTATTENGIETLLAIRHPGDLVGEMAVVADAARSATVTTRGPAEMLAVPAAAFLAFLGRRSAVSLALHAVTTERLAQSNALRADAAAYGVEVRVARALLYQSLRMAVQEGGLTFLELRQGELAMLIGMKEGTVQKALSQGPDLRGLVENQRGRIVVRDLDGLIALAEISPYPRENGRRP